MYEIYAETGFVVLLISLCAPLYALYLFILSDSLSRNFEP